MSYPPKTQPHERAYLLAAAGLLHDVGKVGEPAEIALHPTVENLEQQVCPSDQYGRAQYRHVLPSAQLLHAAQEQGCDFGGLNGSDLFRLVAYHHQQHPDTLDDCLIKKADWLAAGHDRRKVENEDPKAQVVTGLWPILGSLAWPDPQVAAVPAEHRRIVPSCTLSFDEAAFLPGPVQDRATYQARCRQVWAMLQQGVAGAYHDPAEYVECLTALAQRTLSAIPASRLRGQQADVALYDHSRIVAAFAACLAVLFDAQSAAAGVRDPRKIEGRYRLVGIGLGGIQRFILRSVPPLDAGPGETAEKGMARRLRARSFYVSLLTWLAARRLLGAAGLPIVNLMFDGGGRSMLLLPDHGEVMARVEEALSYLDRWVVEQLGGIVRLDVAVSPALTDSAFKEDAFEATIRQIDRQLAEARLRLPAHGLRGPDGWAEGGWMHEQPSLPIDREEFLDAMSDLGRELPKASFISLDGSDQHRVGPRLDIFGYEVRLHDARPNGPRRCFGLRLRPDDDPAAPLFIAANQVPLAEPDDFARLAAGQTEERGRPEDGAGEAGEVLAFGQLARLAKDEEGRPLGHDMLAALKADVDRLGMLLGYGLGQAVSFGRFASVARILDQFFKGFLDKQLQRRYRHVYTVFAGGDDLFLIGPWYDLARLLADLHQWFQAVTCNNPNVTFSAGLVFSQASTPARHLAWLADEALEQAKGRREDGRNRVTFGSTTMTWPQYHEALDLHRLMRELAKPDASGARPVLHSAMVYRLLQYAQMALRSADAEGRKHLPDLKWRAQLSYDLKRNLPAPGDEHSTLARLHHALASIRSADDAAVLHAAATLTLYFLRGVKA